MLHRSKGAASHTGGLTMINATSRLMNINAGTAIPKKVCYQVYTCTTNRLSQVDTWAEHAYERWEKRKHLHGDGHLNLAQYGYVPHEFMFGIVGGVHDDSSCVERTCSRASTLSCE